jgi:hypothetical protein
LGYVFVCRLFELVLLLGRGEREGCANSVSCGEVVFVDEATQPVAAALDRGGWWGRVRSLRADGSGGLRFG